MIMVVLVECRVGVRVCSRVASPARRLRCTAGSCGPRRGPCTVGWLHAVPRLCRLEKCHKKPRERIPRPTIRVCLLLMD